MRDHILPERLRKDYELYLGKLFLKRVNLFCYIALFVFAVEIVIGSIFFSNLLGPKDMPGIAGGVLFSVILLATGKFAASHSVQKIRAVFLTFMLITIAALAAAAHPEIITHLGITLILIALFASALLMPWSAVEAALISLFTLGIFFAVYRSPAIFVTNEIFGINIVLLAVSGVIVILIKRSEEIMSKRAFAARSEVEEKNAIMTKELELANRIHRSLIPLSMKNDLVDIAVSYIPMLYMGGDYAKFHFIDKDRLMLIVADVTGHGVSSALLVNRVHTEIESLIRKDPDPGRLLKALDEFINKDFGTMGYYLSAFCGLLDFSKNKLTYSNHGHPPQILMQSGDRKIVLMESQTLLMGIGMDETDVYNNEITFSRGDRLILFTDGVIEAKDKNGELFEYERLEEFARKSAGADVVEFNTGLIKKLDEFQSGIQNDDIFLLTIQVK